MSTDMEHLAEEVGASEPVTILGGGTKGELGGTIRPGTRGVRAPLGIIEVRARELVAVVGAGTTVADLEAELAAVGQQCGLGGPPGATVGGVFASGHSGIHSRALGPVRDTLLGVSAVDSWGHVVRAGGATVKNVSGFDLCRLWTGSLGTLAVLGELTLRTRPLWADTRWVCGAADPTEVEALAPDATSVLWDGTTVWTHLGGHPDDVSEQCQLLNDAGCDQVADGPPPLPPHRHSLDPALFRAPGFSPPAGSVVEVGVGVVHSTAPPEAPTLPGRLRELHLEVKHRFDPTGRLNPGRSPLGANSPDVGVPSGMRPS